MLLACPGADGAAPMIRTPDALESTIQKVTDLGAIGVIVPTVDDALEARDAARFSRYPPFGRRSSGGGSFGQVWPGAQLPRHRQRQHARRRHDRDARGRRERRGNRGDPRRRRRADRQQRSVELLGVVAERPPLPGRADQGARCGAQVRQVLRQRRRAVPERLRPQRRHAHGAERTGARWMDATARRGGGAAVAARRAGRTRPRRQRSRAGSRAGDRAARRRAARNVSAGPGRGGRGQ